MKNVFLTVVIACTTLYLHAQTPEPAEADIRYTSAHALVVIGRYHAEETFTRFPARYATSLRPAVWRLGQHSAGIAVRFRTDARTLRVRWTLAENNLALPHMPATGVSGVDLYGHVEKGWTYIKTGFPRDTVNEATLLTEGDGQPREYLLHLPLYNSATTVEIGVNADASLEQPAQYLLPDRKPVVYYGTSIAQGGCASRPGMAYTNILARRLDRPFINLGFSGNGTLETSVGEAMCEVDAALFVIDCNPNTKSELIYDRTLALVRMLKQCRPDAPVLLVERFTHEHDPFTPDDVQSEVAAKNRELKRAFNDLRKSGVRDLHYRAGDGLFGQDHEATVDGIHPTDVGMIRMANVLEPVIRKLL